LKKVTAGKLEEGDPSDTESDEDDAAMIDEAFDGLDVPNTDSDSELSSYETSDDDIIVVPDQDGLHVEQVGISEQDRVIRQIGHLHDARHIAEYEKLMQFISLKGIAVSLVDSDPKEILYLSFYEL
jgi:hypothetical protein